MSDQYSVLGSAPTKEDLQKLSPDNVHVQIENYQQAMVKWKFYMILIYL